LLSKRNSRRYSLDPYRVKVGVKAPDFWERKRPTTSGVGTMKATRQQIFPAVFDRPRELTKLPRKDCARWGAVQGRESS
jgi:hypothetical protein